MDDLGQKIRENLARVRQQIDAAAQRSGRRADQVRLVAVTKYVGLDATGALVAAGCHDLGESRPQALWVKAAEIPADKVRWHLIGHLQRNKLRRTLPLISWLHSGDSQRLLEAVDQTAAELNLQIPTLLEVNVSGDASKHGFAPQELPQSFEQLLRLRHLQIRGLMAMAGREDDLTAARAEFAQLRQLRDDLQTRFAGAVQLDQLSMGMSGDFEVAIEEGATMVRVGSALFETIATDEAHQ